MTSVTTPAGIEPTEHRIRCAEELWEQFRNDPHRPLYHFVPPAAWMNDINGPLFWRGRYHIFYQFNPEGAYWKRIQWGHASSVDLVHWVHHPVALEPTPGGPDREGCFSGGVILNEGVPTLVYNGFPEGVCLATCTEDDLVHWTKYPGNPVIRVPQPGDPAYGKYDVGDPCAWRQGDTWYALSGSRVRDGGDTAHLFRSGDLVNWEFILFRSGDLVHWEFVQPFCKSDRRWTEVGEDCVVPDFFPLGGKHMLLFCSHLLGTQYYLGRYEGERFFPETYARMSWPGGHLGGGITMLDGKGRRLYLDWVRELRGTYRERASGWSGVMTLPRVLSLPEDGILRIAPVPELQVLRRSPQTVKHLDLTGDALVVLPQMGGACLELALEVDMGGSAEFGVLVRRSPDGAEQTGIAYDSARQTLSVDVSRASLDRDIRYPYYRDPNALDRLPPERRTVKAQEAPFALSPGEKLSLRIFLDRSIVEVFANGRQCITQRIYPVRTDSTGIALYNHGGTAHVCSLEAWSMAPTNSW